MTLVAALRGLKSVPSDPSSPALQAFESDLTPDDEANLKPYVYAVILMLPENVNYEMLGGVQVIRATVDVVLIERGAGGKRPNRKNMAELRNQILRLAPLVDELVYDVPLLDPKLKYLSGTQPGASFQNNTILTCTLRFQGRWAMKI